MTARRFSNLDSEAWQEWIDVTSAYVLTDLRDKENRQWQTM